MSTTPKQEILSKLMEIVTGLINAGHGVDAADLKKAISSLRHALPADAPVQEVLVRTLSTIMRHQISLDGRLVDVISYLMRTSGVSFEAHPELKIAAVLGSQRNPDRDNAGDRSAALDALLAVVVEERLPYQESLYALASLARQQGLDETADKALALLRESSMGASGTSPADPNQTQISIARPVPQEGDDLGWVVSLMLTLASVAALATAAVKVSGQIKEILGAIDDITSLLDFDK